MKKQPVDVRKTAACAALAVIASAPQTYRNLGADEVAPVVRSYLPITASAHDHELALVAAIDFLQGDVSVLEAEVLSIGNRFRLSTLRKKPALPWQNQFRRHRPAAVL